MIKQILDLVLPRQCVWCGKLWEYICSKCKKGMVIHPEICPICHNESNDYKVCKKCWSKEIEWIIIWFKYSWFIKKLLINIKFLHKKDIWEFIANRLNLVLISNQIWTSLDKDKTILTYIPTHWIKKFFIKWYNQSEIICKELSNINWIKHVGLLKKIKYTKSQVKLDRKNRLINLNGSFWITDNKINWDETIIIVDDITTTWSTIIQTAKIIKEKYPKVKIRWLVVCRH